MDRPVAITDKLSSIMRTTADAFKIDCVVTTPPSRSFTTQ